MEKPVDSKLAVRTYSILQWSPSIQLPSATKSPPAIIEKLPPRTAVSSIVNNTTVPQDYPRGKLTRALSLLLLAVSWAASILCITLSAVLFSTDSVSSPGWLQLRLSRPVKEFLPLLLNFIITLLTEGTGYIHAVSLRWALGSDLVFNSNLRLFSRVRGSWVFGGLSNFFNAGFLVLCYTATGLVFATLPPEKVCAAIPQNYICDETVTRDLVVLQAWGGVGAGDWIAGR